MPSQCLEYSYKVIICPSAEEEATARTGLFFHQAQLRVGSGLTVSFPARAVPATLPRDVARNDPFGDLDGVLTAFHIAPGSDQAFRVGGHAEPVPGAAPRCLEAVVLAARRMLGSAATTGHRCDVGSPSALPRDGLPRQRYELQAVAPLDGDHHVACHDKPFPYAVFQCHMTGLSSTKAYVISQRGPHGCPTVAMAAICHLNISYWNPAHPAFKILHNKPGGAPVCHFMPYANLLFGEKAANA